MEVLWNGAHDGCNRDLLNGPYHPVVYARQVMQGAPVTERVLALVQPGDRFTAREVWHRFTGPCAPTYYSVSTAVARLAVDGRFRIVGRVQGEMGRPAWVYQRVW